jgi:DNA-binding transcriptional LysR family regulator
VLALAPWLLFAGSAYLDANQAPATPDELRNHPSLFMMRTGAAPIWRLRHSTDGKEEMVIPLTPRLLCDDMVALKQAAIAGLGIVSLTGYVCRDDVRSDALRRVLPDWFAGDSTITALIPYRRGLLPSVRAFVDHLVAELPAGVLI